MDGVFVHRWIARPLARFSRVRQHSLYLGIPVHGDRGRHAVLFLHRLDAAEQEGLGQEWVVDCRSATGMRPEGRQLVVEERPVPDRERIPGADLSPGRAEVRVDLLEQGNQIVRRALNPRRGGGESRERDLLAGLASAAGACHVRPGRRSQVALLAKGQGLTLIVETGDRTEEVARRLDRHPRSQRIVDLELRQVTGRAEPRVPIGAVGSQDLARVDVRTRREPAGIADQQRLNRGV